MAKDAQTGSLLDSIEEDPAPEESDRERSEVSELYARERLFQAIADADDVSRSVEVKSKDGRLLYKGIAHGDVTAIAKAVFLANGLLFLPTTKSYERSGNATIVTVLITLVNIDNPADFIEFEWIGQGTDNSDHGPSKAYSDAVKGWMMKALMIGVDDGRGEYSNTPTIPSFDDVAPARLATMLAGKLSEWSNVPIRNREDMESVVNDYETARDVCLEDARTNEDWDTLRAELRFVAGAIAKGLQFVPWCKDPDSAGSALSRRERVRSAARKAGEGGSC